MAWLEEIVGSDQGAPNTAQLCARALILFAYGLLCIRVAGRRTFSSLTPLDIIVAIVVGSNISRAMTGRAPFVPGLAATFLVVVLHRSLAMATTKWSFLAAFIKGTPVVLVRNGVIDHHAMRKNDLSEDDLLEGMRMEKVENVDAVKMAMIERGGKISVIPKTDS